MAEIKVPSSHLRGGLFSERGDIHSGLAKSRPGEIVRKKGEVQSYDWKPHQLMWYGLTQVVPTRGGREAYQKAFVNSAESSNQ
jgi:hypothetical protein